MKWNSTLNSSNNKTKWDDGSGDRSEFGGPKDDESGFEDKDRHDINPLRHGLREVPPPTASYGYFLLVIAGLIFAVIVVIGLYR